MNKVFMSVLKSAVAAWLKTGGCDLKSWAPGAALFHYLEGSGKELNLNQFPHVEELAAHEIAYALSNGHVSENGRKVHCNYFSSSCLDIYMQTPLPDIGRFFDQFNELTATIGGYTAIDCRDHYHIVDRYDWYGVENGVEIPPVVGKFVKQLPKAVINKLGITPNPDREGWFQMNQENLRWVGKAFNSILRVDKGLVSASSSSLSSSLSSSEYEDEYEEEDEYENEGEWFDLELNSPEEAAENGDIHSGRSKTAIFEEEMEIWDYIDFGPTESYVIRDGFGYAQAEPLFLEKWVGPRRERINLLKVVVPYGLSPVWAKAEPIPDPDLEEDYEDEE